MDNQKKNLKGSESRDEFKQKHKNLDKRFYALDVDFVLIEKYPIPGIAAILDYKKNSNDTMTYTEVVAFNDLTNKGIDCFIVEGDGDGPFLIKQYKWGDPKPEPPKWNHKRSWEIMNWIEYEKWERKIRTYYKSKYLVD